SGERTDLPSSPTRRSSDLDHPGDRHTPLPEGKGRIQTAIDTGIQQAQNAPKLLPLLGATFLDGLRMAAMILPSIMAVGLLGLLADRKSTRLNSSHVKISYA